MIEDYCRKGQKHLFDLRMMLGKIIEGTEALKREIVRKETSSNTDAEQLMLDEFSSKMSFKPNPLRLPEGYVRDGFYNERLQYDRSNSEGV